MKYVQQISTGKAVHREEPHTDKTINNAVSFTGIDISDLQVVDDATTEQQWATRLEDEKPWSQKINESDSSMIPRWLEDHIRDDHGGVAGNAQLQAKYDAKVALRNSKPS